MHYIFYLLTKELKKNTGKDNFRNVSNFINARYRSLEGGPYSKWIEKVSETLKGIMGRLW